MAEETNVPDKGVDELAQETTNFAPATIGGTGFQPWEPPTFNVAKVPMSTATVSNPTYRIKDATSGATPNIPRGVDSSTKDFNWGKNLTDKLYAQLDANIDKNAYNKIYGYDSSPKGAHKARYKAYGQKTYDRVGFSPEIDNETWFNQNTTMYDDWKRMATQAAWPMMKLGFMSPIHSYGKLMGGADIGQDIAEARDYEEYNAIGMSTKGGVGGFLVNLQNSAAYSVGILMEGAVEGMLIGGAIGAVAGEGVGAIPGAVVGGITEGVQALLKLPSTLLNMSKNLGKMTMNLSKLKNISEVRNVFNNVGRNMGNFINPISNTTDAAMHYVFTNPDDLSNLARSARTVGAMWHDVKNLNLALSEGRLEGGFTENKVYDELYNKYYEQYNVAPSDDLQKQMRSQAKVAGFQNTWKNTLLVHYSNQIAFPSITRAGFLKGLPKFSKTLGKVGAEYNLVFNPGKTVKEGIYAAEKISLANSLKSLAKPATWGKNGLGYFKANFVEGFQETAQDVLAGATENYYIDSFQNKDRQNFEYSMATLNAAMKKQISKQGLETFASGFAMGSILSIPGGVKDFLSVGYNKYYKHRGNYDQYIEDREAEIEPIVNALNTMHKNGQHFFDPRLNNYTNQMLVGKVADDTEDVTTKELKDHSFAGFFSAVHTSIRSGTFDMFIKNFQGYKEATPEELEDAWRLEPGEGQKALLNIDKAVASAKVIAKRYQYGKDKMKAVLDPNDFAENTPEREQAEIYNEAYLTGLHNLTFMGAAFDNNAERLDAMYAKLSSLKTIQNSRFADIAVLTEPDRLDKEIKMLRTEVKLGEKALTPEAREQYTKQKELLEKLEGYQKEQAGVTVDYIKKVINATTEIAKEQPGLNANELRAKAVEKVTAEYEGAGLNPFISYRDSFKAMLDTIAGSDQNKVSLDRELDDAGGLDTLFEMLMDTHILRNENANLNNYINLLNSPAQFYEHVQRNFEWMKKLYDSRQDYYDEVINNSLINIQRNTLLEELAEDGIFVDLEEFAQWCEDKTPPSYFIDQVNKRVINQDSYLYDKYMKMFDEAEDAETKNPPKPKTKVDEKLQLKINTLNSQRDDALEQVKLVYDKDLKELIGYTQDEIDDKKNELALDSEMDADEINERIDLINKSIKQLSSKNPVEIEAVVDLVSEEELVTPQELNSLKEDVFANEVLIENLTTASQAFTDLSEEDAFNTIVNAYVLTNILENKVRGLENSLAEGSPDSLPTYEDTKPYADYTKSTNEINKKYDDLIEEAIVNFNTAIKEDVDNNRPDAMKKSIKDIEDLFAGQEDVVQTKRNYIIAGKAHERMSNRIKSGYDTYTYAGAQALSDLFDETIGAALAGNTTQTSDTKRKQILDKWNGAKGFYQKNDNISEWYTKRNAELAALGNTVVPGELNQDVIDDFMTALEEANLPGVNTNKSTLPIVRDELETLIAPEGTRLTEKTQKNIAKLEEQIAEVDAKLASVKDKKRETLLNKQKKALEKAVADEQNGVYNEPFEMTTENIKNFVANTVKENAYQESRDGGDLIDPMLKAYLDTATSTKPKFDPDLMSKEAYDALFDDETGYLTDLKNRAESGEIYIFTKNLIVNSDNLVDAEGNKLPPVAGEIDMIIVDREGNKYIVDLKTGKTEKWMYYKILNSSSYKKQLENTLQQTGYANLANNMSGEEFGIKILPIEVAYDRTGKLISAGKPANPVLFADEEVIGDEGSDPYTINLDSGNVIQAKNSETGFVENVTIADLMQRLVPRLSGKTKTPPTNKPGKSNQIIPEEEKAFVEEFVNRINADEDIVLLLIELDEAKPNLSAVAYNMLKDLVNQKMSNTFDETGKINLKTGEIYIFTQPVASLNIPKGYRAVLSSVNIEEGTVELLRVGPGRKKPITMNIADFDKVASTEEDLKNQPEEEDYNPTDEEEDNINEGMNNTNIELSEATQIMNWKAGADNTTLDDLEDDFFNNFKC